jgi:hypothetical protein
MSEACALCGEAGAERPPCVLPTLHAAGAPCPCKLPCEHAFHDYCLGAFYHGLDRRHKPRHCPVCHARPPLPARIKGLCPGCGSTLAALPCPCGVYRIVEHRPGGITAHAW